MTSQGFLFSDEERLAKLKGRVSDLKTEFEKNFSKLKQNVNFLKASSPVSESILQVFHDETAYRENLELQIQLADETAATLKQMQTDLDELQECKNGISALYNLRGVDPDDETF